MANSLNFIVFCGKLWQPSHIFLWKLKFISKYLMANGKFTWIVIFINSSTFRNSLTINSVVIQYLCAINILIISNRNNKIAKSINWY